MQIMSSGLEHNHEPFELPEDFTPSSSDAIVGWARQNYHHRGNQKFRDIVYGYVPQYVNAVSKADKGRVISAIIANLRRESPTGTGLVRQNPKTLRWSYIGLEKAKDKIGHALRKAAQDYQKKMTMGAHHLYPLPHCTSSSSLGALDNTTTSSTRSTNSSASDYEDDVETDTRNHPFYNTAEHAHGPSLAHPPVAPAAPYYQHPHPGYTYSTYPYPHPPHNTMYSPYGVPTHPHHEQPLHAVPYHAAYHPDQAAAEAGYYYHHQHYLHYPAGTDAYHNHHAHQYQHHQATPLMPYSAAVTSSSTAAAAKAVVVDNAPKTNQRQKNEVPIAPRCRDDCVSPILSAPSHLIGGDSWEIAIHESPHVL